MDGFSVRHELDPEVEIGSLDEGSPLMHGDDPDAPEIAEGWRFASQTRRDDELFERAWFADFRERWRRDLAMARITFQARMRAIGDSMSWMLVAVLLFGAAAGLSQAAEAACETFGGVTTCFGSPAPAPTPPPPVPTPVTPPPLPTDTETWAEPGAQPSVSGVGGPGGYQPHILLLLTNPNTTLKTGLFVESIAAGTDTPIANEGVFVFHFSQKDNGHDASGITSVETGNGNAASFMKFVQARPAGLPALLDPTSRQYGYAVEAMAQGDSTSIMSSSERGIAYAAGVGTFPGAEGILIFPHATADNAAARVAIRVTRNPNDLVDTNNDAFRVMLDGTTTIPGLGGVGNAQLCLTAQGTLYRGTPGC